MLCGEDLDLELQLVVLDRLLKATTKKVVNFLRKKVHPRQNPGYAYVHRHRGQCHYRWARVELRLALCLRYYTRSRLQTKQTTKIGRPRLSRVQIQSANLQVYCVQQSACALRGNNLLLNFCRMSDG